ncbi:beta/gamma crystallin-related protein [Sphingorhabdus sp.]|uniref:beta/gamma crystallin-related protein n=1 Tax=Sphingorhabdus sp. TaxID=1902408 RepID=UPI00391C01E8
MKKSSSLFLLAGAAAALTSASVAQTDKMAPMGRGEATIYRDPGFQGPAVFVGEAKSNLALRWSVRSIRVRSGTWELCARTRFRSPCVTVSADETDIRRFAPQMFMVQSMRPLGYAPPAIIHPPAGTSLRGMASEFFPAPGGRDGRRLLSCENGSATANCAAATADRFCKSIGWSGSASQQQETVNGRVYLADVLCTRTGY